MLAIPLDSDPIFCRDTIICAVAAADEDDDNKLESTADITNRDRSEDAEGLSRGRGWGSSGGRKAGGRNDGGRGAELSLFSPPKEIAKKRAR